MDHVKKLVYTIVGCLTIVSLTFTICTKIGHCENTIYYTDFPLPIGNDIGGEIYWTEDDYNAVMRLFANYNIPPSKVPYLLINEITDVNHYVLDVFFVMNENPNVFPTVTYDISNSFRGGSVSFRGGNIGVRVDSSNHTASFYNNGNIRTITLYLSNALNEDLTLKSGYIYHYPIYSYYDNEIYATDDTLLFSNSINPTPTPGGHTKGGVLSNYIDSQDLIEDSSEVNKVDITPPADSSSIPGWLQKILGGLGTINGSIQSGVLTIGDYIGQLKESVENAIAWLTEPYDSQIISSNVSPFLSDNVLIQGFNSSKTSIQGVYNSIGSVSAKTRSQMVWDIPFNLPTMSQTFHAEIDFGWYENIRSTFEPFLNMFLCIGFLFSFIRSIPGILHGNSGEGDT